MVAPLPLLNLALAPQGFWLIRVAQWTMALLIVGSLSLAAWFWWDSRFIEEEKAQYKPATQRVRETTRQFVTAAARAGLDISEARINALVREVGFSNQLLEKRAFSWTRFLSHLEEAVPARVSVSAVALNFNDSTITLNGSALTLKDMTALVNGLEDHPAFHDVVPSQYQFRERDAEGSGQGSGKEKLQSVEFRLTVTYRPPF